MPAHIRRRRRTFCKLQARLLLQRHWKLLLKLHKLRGSKGVEAVLLTLQANTASEVQTWQQNKQKLCSCLSPTLVLLYLWCNSQLRAACSLSTTDVNAEGEIGESVNSDDKAETAKCCAGLCLQQTAFCDIQCQAQCKSDTGLDFCAETELSDRFPYLEPCTRGTKPLLPGGTAILLLGCKHTLESAKL